jgi:hypothetical protein
MAQLTPVTGSLGGLGLIGITLAARSSIIIIDECFRSCADPSTTYACAMSMSDANFSAMVLHVGLLVAMLAAVATAIGLLARRLLKFRTPRGPEPE